MDEESGEEVFHAQLIYGAALIGIPIVVLVTRPDSPYEWVIIMIATGLLVFNLIANWNERLTSTDLEREERLLERTRTDSGIILGAIIAPFFADAASPNFRRNIGLITTGFAFGIVSALVTWGGPFGLDAVAATRHLNTALLIYSGLFVLLGISNLLISHADAAEAKAASGKNTDYSNGGS